MRFFFHGGTHDDTVFFDCSTKHSKVCLSTLSSFLELLFGLGDALVPVAGWLGVSLFVEGNLVHHGDMLLPVPVDSSMPILALEWVILDVVLFHQLEECLVSAKRHASQLVVIPMLSKHVFDVAVLVSAKGDSVHVGAVLA